MQKDCSYPKVRRSSNSGGADEHCAGDADSPGHAAAVLRGGEVRPKVIDFITINILSALFHLL